MGVVNARFIRPLDERVMQDLADISGVVVTIEENAIRGGFGAPVTHWLESHDVLDRVRMVQFGLPDSFIEHGPRQTLLDLAGLGIDSICERLVPLVGPPMAHSAPKSAAPKSDR